MPLTRGNVPRVSVSNTPPCSKQSVLNRQQSQPVGRRNASDKKRWAAVFPDRRREKILPPQRPQCSGWLLIFLGGLGGVFRQVSTSSPVPDCSKTTILITEAVKMWLSLLRCSSFTGAQRRLWENNYSLSLLWFAKEKKGDFGNVVVFVLPAKIFRVLVSIFFPP